MSGQLPPIGAHVSSSGGIGKALDRAVALGADALQLFVSSPRAWKVTPLAAVEAKAFCERRQQLGIRAVLVHGLYLCNFASEDKQLWQKSVAAISASFDSASKIEADLCFHLGSHKGGGLDGSLDRIVSAIDQTITHCQGDNWLLLENTAGAGGTIGRSIDELATIIDQAGAPERLGLCLDTCHLYASGYDLCDEQVVNKLIAEIDEKIGLQRLRAIHANDSKTPLGSNRDRHENLLEGEIGKGLAIFLRQPALQNIPVFLETPGEGNGPTSEQVERLKALY